MSEVRTRKRAERRLRRALRVARRDQRKMHRKRRRAELLCFWTWPFRHVWNDRSIEDDMFCVGCGKSRGGRVYFLSHLSVNGAGSITSNTYLGSRKRPSERMPTLPPVTSKGDTV